MKRRTPLIVTIAMAVMPVGFHAQQSPLLLERSRIVTLDPGKAWANSVAIVKAAPVIVNVMDPASKLAGFTMALSGEDVKSLLLDAKEVEKQPHTLHVTIWVTAASQGTRLFVRAAPNGAGFFAHSTGQVEKEILDAIEKGTIWRSVPDDPSRLSVSKAPPEAAFKSASGAALASPRTRLNVSNPDVAVLTCSLMIASSELKTFTNGVAQTKGAAQQIYPGAAHLTLWFEPSHEGTTIRSRSLILESGSLSPVSLPSNGRLESAVLKAMEERLGTSPDAVIDIGSDYRGKAAFWTILFGFRASDSKRQSGLAAVRELPAPMEHAWQSTLQVVTQSQVIVEADRLTGVLGFIAAHTSETGTKYSLHKVELVLAATDFGTRLTISIPDTQETAEESERELKAIAERIGTELFLRERLTWLTKKKKEGAK